MRSLALTNSFGMVAQEPEVWLFPPLDLLLLFPNCPVNADAWRLLCWRFDYCRHFDSHSDRNASFPLGPYWALLDVGASLFSSLLGFNIRLVSATVWSSCNLLVSPRTSYMSNFDCEPLGKMLDSFGIICYAGSWGNVGFQRIFGELSPPSY